MANDRDTEDAKALKWAGMMGHTVAVVIDEGRSNLGLRMVTAELTDVKKAREMVISERTWLHPQIWEKTRKGWRKRMTPTASI